MQRCASIQQTWNYVSLGSIQSAGILIWTHNYFKVACASQEHRGDFGHREVTLRGNCQKPQRNSPIFLWHQWEGKDKEPYEYLNCNFLHFFNWPFFWLALRGNFERRVSKWHRMAQGRNQITMSKKNGSSVCRVCKKYVKFWISVYSYRVTLFQKHTIIKLCPYKQQMETSSQRKLKAVNNGLTVKPTVYQADILRMNYGLSNSHSAVTLY